MRKNSKSQSAFLNLRVSLGFALCAVGTVFAMLSFAAAAATWSIVSSPNTDATQSNQLSGVTCPSASDCWAVGSYNNGNVFQTLIEHWDGAFWAIVVSPNIAPVFSNVLLSVACASASECWAVGYSVENAQQTFIERWDGTS